jgi:hypothetical protein
MNLTTKQLKQIIKEEFQEVLRESEGYAQKIIDLASADEESFKSAMHLLESIESMMSQEEYDFTVRGVMEVAKNKKYYQAILDMLFSKNYDKPSPIRYKLDKWWGNHKIELDMDDYDTFDDAGGWVGDTDRKGQEQPGIIPMLAELGIPVAVDPPSFYIGESAEVFNKGAEAAKKVGFFPTYLSIGVETEDDEFTLDWYGRDTAKIGSRWSFGGNNFARIVVGPDVWKLRELGGLEFKKPINQSSWKYVIYKDLGIAERGSIEDAKVKEMILEHYPDLERALSHQDLF